MLLSHLPATKRQTGYMMTRGLKGKIQVVVVPVPQQLLLGLTQSSREWTAKLKDQIGPLFRSPRNLLSQRVVYSSIRSRKPRTWLTQLDVRRWMRHTRAKLLSNDEIVQPSPNHKICNRLWNVLTAPTNRNDTGMLANPNSIADVTIKVETLARKDCRSHHSQKPI
jgi:hypothetical protein